MNLPIPPSPLGSVTLVREATRLAGQVARTVRGAIGFDQVLADSGDTPTKPVDVDSLRADLADHVQRLLADSGIELGAGVNLRVTPAGQFQVEGPHGRGAEIEAILNGDSDLAQRAAKLLEKSGPQLSGNGLSLGIGLTGSGGPANILRSPGGYPNW